MQKKTIYLAGAIEAAPDRGEGWRASLQPQLESLGFNVFNPCDQTDIPILESLGWEKFDWTKIRTPKYRDAYLKIMDKIVQADLKALLASSVVLVYFDEYVSKGAGTYGEITVAKHCGIPVYVVLAEGIEFQHLPAWVVGCMTRSFDSLKEFKDFIKVEDSER